jgi:hypothetical protein
MIFIEKIFAAGTPLGGTIGGNGEGLGPFAGKTQSGTAGGVQALQQVTQVVSSVLGVMTITAGIWFLFNIVVAGIQYISAGGDKHNLEDAQKRITNALIGIVIVAASWSILALVGRFLGIDTVISNPGTLMSQLFGA